MERSHSQTPDDESRDPAARVSGSAAGQPVPPRATPGRPAVQTVAPPRAPGRPRSARVHEAIVEAVLNLLQDGVGVDALTMDSVAARAGVGKATIYRRWPNKEALLVDAVRTLKGEVPRPVGAHVRDDLIMLLSAMNQPHDARAMSVLPCLVPEVYRNPVQHRIYQEVIEPRREAMREVLRRGVRTGELRADIDIELTMALLSGPILVQKVLRWNPALDDSRLPERVVDAILAGIAT